MASRPQLNSGSFSQVDFTGRSDCVDGGLLSEFYQLRRTSIKDLAAYCGFLIGFLGSAPLAWRYLAAEVEVGNFSQGLWYFFGVVAAAAIFAGTIGLGAGIVVGWLWERYHRHRRTQRQKVRPALPGSAAPVPIADARARGGTGERAVERPFDAPRLQLVPPTIATFPDVTQRRLTSIRFLLQSVELDFGGVVFRVTGRLTVSCGSEAVRYPEAGSRDALCRMIGATVNRMRINEANEVLLGFDGGCELVIPRDVGPDSN